MLIKQIAIGFFLFLCTWANAQHTRTIEIATDTLITDSLTIVFFETDPVEHVDKVVIQPDGKSIKISRVDKAFLLRYDVLSFNLSQSYYRHRLEDDYDSTALFKRSLRSTNRVETEKPWIKNDKIQAQGAITRGVTLGNTQSLTMQSRLNLQLEGQLNDNLNISANITDQQIPYLPEGNSQYLREFDNVSVKLYNDKFALEAGDQLWVNDKSFFGAYTRNVEGARASVNHQYGNGIGTTYLGASSAKGKFAREFLEVEDGVLGPYRIPRPAASANVVILPGSEKIFLDGEELLRGVNNDYVIDYMQGELTFTTNVLLTRFSRVIIEFEYTQLTFQQNSIMAGHEYSSEKLDLFISFFQQKDNPRQPVGIDLSMSDLEQLNGISHNGVIVLPAIDSTGYSESGILYARRDTITPEGRAYTLYEYSSDPNEAFYRLSFRESDRGNYVIRDYSGEGKIYQWVAPVNGQPQGRFEPEVAFDAPATTSVLSMGGNYGINNYQEVQFEFSNSNYSNNNLDSENLSNGTAALLAYKSIERPVSFIDKYTLSHGVNLQWIDNTFTSPERIRAVEFERLWMTSDSINSDDVLLTGNIQLKKSSDQQFNYSFSRRMKGDFEGNMHQMIINQRFKNLYAKADGQVTRSGNPEINSEWINYKLDVFYKVGVWQPGARVLSERNSIFNLDSLYGSANNFIDRQIYLNRTSDAKGNLRLLYSQRDDYLPSAGEFEQLSNAHTFLANLDYQDIDLRMTYRKLNINTEAEEVISGDVTIRKNIGKLFQQDIGYGISQGRELRRALQYIQVAPGEGTHTWRDIDSDGIKDIDEFFEALNIDERNYIKILIPTDEFVSAYETRFSYRGNFHMPEHWKEKEGLLRFFSRLRTDVNIRSVQKTSSDQWGERLLPFKNMINEADIISEKRLLHSRMILTRTREKFGGAISYSSNNRRQLFQGGVQDINRQAWDTDAMYSLTHALEITINGSQGEEILTNGFSDEGSYAISFHKFSPTLTYSPNSNWRIGGGVVAQNRNSIEDEQYANHNEVNTFIKVNSGHSFFTSTLRMINIDFVGTENSAAGYALLNALRPGTNFYWQFNLQQKISGALRLALFYDGRKSEDNNAIHMGRVQVTALF